MSSAPDDNRLAWLFARFAAIFGSKWTRPLDDELAYKAAVNEWGKAIAALTPDQVRQGVESAKAGDDWPPSIPAFLRMALGMPDPFVAAANAARMSDDPLSREIRTRAGGQLVRMASAQAAYHLCERAYSDIVHELNNDLMLGRPCKPVAWLEAKREQRRIDAKGTDGRGLIGWTDSIPQHLRG